MDKAERRQRERRGHREYLDSGTYFYVRVLDDDERTLGVIMLERRQTKDGEEVYKPHIEYLYDKRGREANSAKKPNYGSGRQRVQEAVGMFDRPEKLNLRPSKIRLRKAQFGLVQFVEFPTWKARAETLQPVWKLLVMNKVHEVTERGLRLLIQETSGQQR